MLPLEQIVNDNRTVKNLKGSIFLWKKVIVYLEMLNITQYYGFEYLKYVKNKQKI